DDIGVAEIHLELGIGAFTHDIFQTPSHAVQHFDDVGEEGHGVERELDVIPIGLSPWAQAATGLWVVVESFHRPAILVIAQDDELRLHPGVERVPRLRTIPDRALERHPRADIVWRVFEKQVGEDDGDLWIPGTDLHTVKVGYRDLVRVGRAQ